MIIYIMCHYNPLSIIKPSTDAGSNLLAIDFQLYMQIACDCLQQKFQHAENLLVVL